MNTRYRRVLTPLVFVCTVTGLVVSQLPPAAHAQRLQLEDRANDTIRERAVVESVRSIDLRCEVQGGSTVLSVVPDGSSVKKGDLLVELDSARFQEMRAEAQIKTEQTKVQLIQSKAEFESLKKDGEIVLDFAKKSLATAKLAYERVLNDGGELDYEMKAVDSELTIAKARLEAAKNLIKQGPKDRGGKTLNDLQLMVVEATETIKVAEARRHLLEKHERRYRTALLDLAVAENEMQLIRQKSDFDKALRLAEVDVLAKELALAQQQRQLKKVQTLVEKCKIYAPQDGIILYCAPSSRTGRAVVIEEGSQVRERQPIVRLPDMNNLRIRMHVDGSRISQVRSGQVVKILVDAYPDKVLRGKVTDVNKVPEPTSPSDDVKKYAVLVSIDGPTDFLKIGLTALVEIAVN